LHELVISQQLRFASLTSYGHRITKRTVDLIVAIAGIFVLLPLWIAIALAIKLTSPGPLLHRQKDVAGKSGQPFTMYKFRTMYVGGDDSAHQQAIEAFVKENRPFSIIRDKDGNEQKVYKFVNDPRVTTVGRFLRRTGLDEAPQFLNVIRGEMSMVGPRPSSIAEVRIYEDWHRQRLSALPGITGLYQVTARSMVPFDEMVRIDLEYIRRRSLWLDLKIMFLTPINVIILRKGGY
jgi:lipopolysaccharide/colanic/teichoic acid biosynthesis glycosyltransferase